MRTLFPRLVPREPGQGQPLLLWNGWDLIATHAAAVFDGSLPLHEALRLLRGQ